MPAISASKSLEAGRGGIFICRATCPTPPNNGSIKNIAKVIDAIVSSAAEAELGALSINAREAVYL